MCRRFDRIRCDGGVAFARASRASRCAGGWLQRFADCTHHHAGADQRAPAVQTNRLRSATPTQRRPRQPRAHLTRAATHRPRIHQLPALNRNFCNFAGSYRTIASQNHTAKQPFPHPLEESALGKQYVPTPLALAGDEGAEESFKDQYGIAIAGQAATRNGNILQPPHRSPTRKPHRQFGDR